MWIVACVRCGVVHYQQTRMDARGHAEAHALAHGCQAHTFFWECGEGARFSGCNGRERRANTTNHLREILKVVE